ncbi:MAG: cell division protein SepF [Nanobdellota archaeon]
MTFDSGGYKMKKFFNKIRGSLKNEETNKETNKGEEEYVELDTASSEESDQNVTVRPYVLEDFSEVKQILDTLRKGDTIALINIKPLKDKDLVELKRSINKLKKTCNAIDGDIAGFGDDYIVVVPSFAKIHRGKDMKEQIDVDEKDE